MSENVPTNKELYNRVKAEAKKKFDVYPSAYANGWLVREYKKRGGGYKKKSKGAEKKSSFEEGYERTMKLAFSGRAADALLPLGVAGLGLAGALGVSGENPNMGTVKGIGKDFGLAAGMAGAGAGLGAGAGALASLATRGRLDMNDAVRGGAILGGGTGGAASLLTPTYSLIDTYDANHPVMRTLGLNPYKGNSVAEQTLSDYF